MQSILRASVLCLLAGMAFMSANLAVAAVTMPNQAAYDVVQHSTDELLKAIVENREVYREDNERFLAEVDGLLSPVVDFSRISRRVMAKYYKRATADQRVGFERVFKQSLMKVYAKGLLEFDNQRLEIVPPSEGKKKRASKKKQKVDIVIYGKNGKKYPITYSMFLSRDGGWKMENVIVNGINIGLTYRNQFARLMKVNKNNVDEVITNWTSEVNAPKEK